MSYATLSGTTSARSSKCAARTVFLGLLTGVAILTGSCGPKAEIVGEVRDGFGNPLSNVEISIPGTALQTKTNVSGKYGIPFVPGKFSINFTKEGYTTFSLSQEVSVETRVPLQSIVLYKRPSEQGVWFFGGDDYVRLKPGTLLTTGGDRSKFAWVDNMTYQVSGDFTNVPVKSSYRFLDTDSAHLILLKVADNGLLATRAESWQGMGQTTSSVVSEKYNKVADGIDVREVQLQPGKYAYVGITTGNMGLGPTRPSEPVFPFEVR